MGLRLLRCAASNYNVANSPVTAAHARSPHQSINERGEPTAKLQMNRLSLRNYRFQFKAARKFLIILEECKENYLKL